MPDNTVDFWKRPEGKTAKIIVSALGIAALVGAWYALPFLITIAENTIYLGVLLGVIGAMYLVVTSTRVHTLLFYALASISRAITANFVAIDPIGILKEFVGYLKGKQSEVDGAIEKMMGVRQKANGLKATAVKEMNDYLRLADAAEQTGNQIKMAELTEKIGRRQKKVQNLDSNIQFANDTIETLNGVKSVIEYQISNSIDEMDDLTNDNDMAIQMLAASAAASKALGDTDKLAVKNMAADVIRDRVANAKGVVEHLMESTKSMRGDMDLTQIAFQQDGRAKLDAIRKQVLLSQQEALPPATRSGGRPTLTAGPMQDIARIGGEEVPVSNKWAGRLRNPNK